MSQSTQLSTFNFEQSSIRVIAVNNEPWFIAKDVCEAVNISNYRDAIERLDDDEKGVALTDTLGGQQEMNIISESGMYTLILRCRDAVKKGSVPHRFRKWVTAEVLPQIRKTGSYQRKTTVDERTGLRDAVNMLVSKRGLIYSEAYQMVHQRFNVQSIEDLSKEQLPMAVEYVHKICLEGELIIQDPNKPNPDEITVPYNLFQALYHHGRRGQRLGHQVNMLFQILRLDLSQARFVAVGLAHDCVTESSTWLDKAEEMICKRQIALQIVSKQNFSYIA